MRGTPFQVTVETLLRGHRSWHRNRIDSLDGRVNVTSICDWESNRAWGSEGERLVEGVDGCYRWRLGIVFNRLNKLHRNVWIDTPVADDRGIVCRRGERHP